MLAWAARRAQQSESEPAVLIISTKVLTSVMLSEPEPQESRAAKVPRAAELLASAQLVVMDEAHELRNASTQLFHAMQRLGSGVSGASGVSGVSGASGASGASAARRLALTGFPLQNNLEEYHTMLSWASPEALRTAKEFRDTFIEVIDAGHRAGASTSERRKAAHALFALQRAVEPIVHRRGRELLEVDLPPKTDTVLLLRMTPLQEELCRAFLALLDSGAPGGSTAAEAAPGPGPSAEAVPGPGPAMAMEGVLKRSLFRDMHILDLILNQPKRLEDVLRKAELGEALDAPEEVVAVVKLPQAARTVLFDVIKRVKREQVATGYGSSLWGLLPKQLIIERMLERARASADEKLVLFSASLGMLDDLQAKVR